MIKGGSELSKRNDSDLIDTLLFLTNLPLWLRFLVQPRGGVNYSDWVIQWLKQVGFKITKTYYFDIKVNTKKKFAKLLGQAKKNINKFENSKLSEGLLKELNKIINEYKRRGITERDFFKRRHYIIRAKK